MLLYEQQAIDGGIWGPLLEKVWAKTNGYYRNIFTGTFAEAFDFLTGAPSKIYELSGPKMTYSKEAFEIITEAHKARRIITFALLDADQFALDVPSVYGLLYSHVYSLIDIVHLKDKSGKVAHKLYKIRNPWRGEKGTYAGPWSPNDNIRWTKEYQ